MKTETDGAETAKKTPDSQSGTPNRTCINCKKLVLHALSYGRQIVGRPQSGAQNDASAVFSHLFQDFNKKGMLRVCSEVLWRILSPGVPSRPEKDYGEAASAEPRKRRVMASDSPSGAPSRPETDIATRHGFR